MANINSCTNNISISYGPDFTVTNDTAFAAFYYNVRDNGERVAAIDVVLNGQHLSVRDDVAEPFSFIDFDAGRISGNAKLEELADTAGSAQAVKVPGEPESPEESFEPEEDWLEEDFEPEAYWPFSADTSADDAMLIGLIAKAAARHGAKNLLVECPIPDGDYAVPVKEFSLFEVRIGWRENPLLDAECLMGDLDNNKGLQAAVELAKELAA